MIKAAQIEPLQDLNHNPTKSKMKGSTLRYNYAKVLNIIGASQTILINDLSIIQAKGSPKEGVNQLQMNENQEIANKSGKIEHPIAKTIPMKIAKQREYACLSARPTTPIMAKQYTKTLSQSDHKLKQRPSSVMAKEIQRYLQIQDRSIRLSLSHFQDRMKTISLEKKIERVQDNAVTLKLEGINCKISKKKSNNSKAKNLDVSQLFEKQNPIYLTQQQRSIEPDNFISKKQSSTYRPLSSFDSRSRSILVINRRHNITSAMSRRSVGSRNIESARPSAKVNIINMIDSSPLDRKRNNNQIFAKFCKTNKTISPNTEEIRQKSNNVVIKIELYEELKELKRQMENRRAANTKHVLARQKQAKYTTNIVEERLNRRKSIIKKYTFKKLAVKPKAKCVAVDDFHVEGWNNQQHEHKEAIVA